MPAAKARAAANRPMVKVSKPDRHHAIRDHRLLTDPMAKKTAAVETVDRYIGAGRPATRGSSGTDPQIRKARKVLAAALSGDRRASGRPYSSRSIVSTQRWRSAVMTSTTFSRRLPWNPLAR